MKKGINRTNDQIVSYLKVLHHSNKQGEYTIKENRVKGSISEMKTPSEYLVKEHACRTKLYIKNMVSTRCKMAVMNVLEDLGLNYSTLELGEVEIMGSLSEAKREQFKSNLFKYGLELIEDRKKVLVEKIKVAVIEMIHSSNELPSINFSDYLSEKLNYDYTYLSNIFSETKGMSIQHFIILHKIERVKELLVNDELTLSEIAWKLHYSSVAHLSNQFKKSTGLTPTDFKNMEHKIFNSLDTI